jgi:hypothetical protein
MRTGEGTNNWDSNKDNGRQSSHNFKGETPRSIVLKMRIHMLLLYSRIQKWANSCSRPVKKANYFMSTNGTTSPEYDIPIFNSTLIIGNGDTNPALRTEDFCENFLLEFHLNSCP